MIPHYKNKSIEDIEGEVWKDVLGWKGLYMASNFGRVKSLTRKIKRRFSGTQTLNGRILSQFVCKNGYITMHMCHDHKPTTVSIQIIIMRAFNGYSNLHIDHIDRDKTNNCIENLRYCTPIENISFKNPKSHLPMGVYQNPKNYKTKPYRARISTNGRFIELGSFSTVEEASNAYQKERNKQIEISINNYKTKELCQKN